MSDLGHEQTDKELKKIENIITKEYKQAAQDVEDKMLKHFDDFNAKDIMMRKKVESGQITESQYNQWRIGQMATGERWISLRDSLTSTLVNADKVATQIIQGNSIKAYGDNMNYGTYEIEHGSKINTGFVLYDSDTVINLMKDDPKIIPLPRLDIPKDEQWNRQKLTSSVMQGILQGESIPKIADRLQDVAFMGRNAAIRNARTYTTAAENKGRIDSYERAEKMGIKTNKKWIATLDDRTRAEHRHLDNMSIPYDEKFETDGYTIGFPGDPSAEPEMFYNCRCTLVADIVGYPYNDERNDSKLGDMSYEEWKHAKDKPQKEEENKPTSNIIFADNVKDETKDLILKLEEQYNTRLGEVSLGANKGAGDVDIAGYTMRLSSEKPDVIFHEFAHTLANSSADKYGLTNDSEFWKEIDKVKKEYRKEVGQDTSRWISSYEHGRNDKDEFFAESFAMAKMKEMGLEIPDKYGDDFTYADRVLEITDKYFGKEVGSEENQEEIKPEPDTKNKIEFIPAKNISEAEEYAKQFAENVDYKGISIDKVNAINEQLTILNEKYPTNKLDEISQKGGKQAASANYHRLTINKKNLGKTLDDDFELFQKEQEQTRQAIEDIKSRYPSGKMPPSMQDRIDRMENQLKYDRWSVLDSYDDKLQALITHEYGHIFADQYFAQINTSDRNLSIYQYSYKKQQWDDIYKKAVNNGDIYKMSKYGGTNSHEYFAECFCAREFGETIPDYAEDFIKELLNGKPL